MIMAMNMFERVKKSVELSRFDIKSIAASCIQLVILNGGDALTDKALISRLDLNRKKFSACMSVVKKKILGKQKLKPSPVVQSIAPEQYLNSWPRFWWAKPDKQA